MPYFQSSQWHGMAGHYPLPAGAPVCYPAQGCLYSQLLFRTTACRVPSKQIVRAVRVRSSLSHHSSLIHQPPVALYSSIYMTVVCKVAEVVAGVLRYIHAVIVIK